MIEKMGEYWDFDKFKREGYEYDPRDHCWKRSWTSDTTDGYDLDFVSNGDHYWQDFEDDDSKPLETCSLCGKKIFCYPVKGADICTECFLKLPRENQDRIRRAFEGW